VIGNVLITDWSMEFRNAFDRAVSAEATHANLNSRCISPRPRSVSIDQPYCDALEALFSVLEETELPNWDGYGAKPVSMDTFAKALAFLDVLPSTFPRPEISALPDGEIAFEWRFGPRRLLTLAINESGRLTYAALTGRGYLHGTEYLLDALPRQIIDAFRSTTPSDQYGILRGSLSNRYGTISGRNTSQDHYRILQPALPRGG
jgi:hypothetical protein